MEQQRNHLDLQTLSCPICLDPLVDPVTIPCGHNCCLDCIKDHWDEEDQKGIYSCPQCGETFNPNTIAAVVEGVANIGLEQQPEPGPEPQPETRAEFLRYSRDLTLDPNTAHRRLVLFDGDRRVTAVKPDQPHPDHPDRFTRWRQVLSRESLTGRCYWEVELRGEGRVAVAVAYEDTSRGEGFGSRFGWNNTSWALRYYLNDYRFTHNNKQTPLSGPPPPSRIGVYLDHTKGVLSFYNVSESGSMTRLHRVQTSFTDQPLHAGLRLWSHGLTAEFLQLRR